MIFHMGISIYIPEQAQLFLHAQIWTRLGGCVLSISPIFLRNATMEDAATLAAFAADTFRQAFQANTSPEQIEGYIREAYGEAMQRSAIEDSNVKVNLSELRESTKAMLVGYAQITVDRGKASSQLNRIYVENGWHGTGVAATLLDEVLRECHVCGSKRLWLIVLCRNERAIAFYKKAGFRVSEELSVPWGHDVEACLVMELSCE